MHDADGWLAGCSTGHDLPHWRGGHRVSTAQHVPVCSHGDPVGLGSDGHCASLPLLHVLYLVKDWHRPHPCREGGCYAYRHVYGDNHARMSQGTFNVLMANVW